MSEEEEIQQLTKIDPKVVQTLLLFKMYKSLKRMEKGSTKLGAFATYKGPMNRMFPRGSQYQYATISAGSSGRVYHLLNPQPDLLMGIIVQVANSWFTDTYLDWLIDYEPKKVEYVIADIEKPKEYERGIPFEREIEWIAYNNSDEDHVFEVLCDGYFIDKTVYKRIVGVEGKVPILSGVPRVPRQER